MLPEEKLARLRLIRAQGIGPVRYRDALRVYLTAERALEKLPERFGKAGAPAPRVPSGEELLREAEALAARGGFFVIEGETLYPEALRGLPDSPPVFAYIGDPSLLQRPAVALVGGRNASAGGLRMASLLAAGAAEAGYVVISGLARGVDRAAHESALAVNGGTIAIVAGGIDVIYPPEHADLYRQLCLRGGVLAETPLGAEPAAPLFPRRNRIISGLSCVTVVAEAGTRSGSLITARFAAEQGREVAAVPGSPLDPRCAGSNLLLQRGAHVVVSAEDLVRLARSTCAQQTLPGFGETEAPAYQAAVAPEPEERELDAARPRVASALGPDPVWPEAVARAARVPVRVATALILELDLAGKIERLPDGRVSLLY